ncbi:MAG: SDR family oxidoreductase [Rhizobiaceae bacterium]|nr:SDR family oxidoreductase [Hyphomicrobiales bacterium]NRB30449.1 SDR family oxidoreductase [Rhizobiaceae bacterium]
MTEVAVVTGAARGIGLATTRRFVNQGMKVAMIDRDADVLLEEAKQIGDAAVPIVCDVSIPEQVDAAVAEIADGLGACNALINNAGVADFGPIAETSFERWRRVMATNLDGVFLVSQAMIPLLAKTAADSYASIVNIASISGLRASTLRVAYGTSKAAVIQLTLQQAAELGELGIRANCVAPGPVNTKLALAVHTKEIRAAYHDALPLNRYGSEDEIASAICYLASKDASFITGQLLAADGGFEAVGIGLPALRS